ncbi:MAG: hypothetical protein LVQ95_02050 [Candidatus Micrarchaeales archaeon]|nr:hypothetical protein [Candidatus Micrarchaeales archaeon]
MIGIIGFAVVLTLSLGSAWTLAPIIVIFVLIVAAAGLTRGGDFFSFLGLGALLGITSGVGKGGAGKGLRSASAVGRRSIKKNVKGLNPLKKKAAALGKARALAKVEKKQAKVVGKIGEATRSGNLTRAEQLKQQLIQMEVKKTAKFGGSKGGMVNQAVKLHKGGILGQNAETQKNLAAGFAYLNTNASSTLAAGEARVGMARAAAGAAGGATLAGWSAGANLRQAIRHHQAMQSLFGTSGGFNKTLANPPKSTLERLSAWISNPTVPSAFQKQNILSTLTPWVPGLGAVLIGYGAYQATKGSIAQGYRTATAQATAVQAKTARAATDQANAYAAAAQVANATAAAQYTAASAAVSGGATLLTNTQTSNTNSAVSYNAAQVSATRAKAQADLAQAAAAEAAQQTTGALNAVDKAQQLITSAKERATDLAEQAAKLRAQSAGMVKEKEQATDLAEQAARFRAAGNMAEASAKEAQVAALLQAIDKPIAEAINKEAQAAALLQSIASASPKLTEAKEKATDSAEATNKARAAAKTAEEAQKDADHYSGLASQAQSAAQFTSNVASMAQEELNSQARLLKASSDAVAKQVQVEADGQRSLAQALTIQAASNDPLIKAQAAKQAEAAQALIDQAGERRAYAEKAMAQYMAGVSAATDKLNTAQTEAAAAEQKADTARKDADAAAAKAASAFADAQRAEREATAKAIDAYTTAAKVITDSGATPPARPAPIAAPAPPPPPASVTANNPAPAPPPAWGTFTPKPQTSTVITPPPPAAASLTPDYQDLKDREAAIQNMQAKADTLRTKAAGPLVQPEFSNAMNQHADVLETLALVQNTALIDEVTAYRYRAATDQAQDEAKEDKGWLSQYRGFYAPDVERLGHEEDVRTQLLKQELGSAWTKEANEYFENERSKKIKGAVERQMSLEEEALESQRRRAVP